MKATLLAIAMAMLIGLPTAQGDESASRPSKTVKAFREVRIDAPDVYLDVVQDFEKNYLSDFRLDPNRAPAYFPDIHIEQSAVNDAPVLLISVKTPGPGGMTADAAETADQIVGQLRSRLAMLTQQRRAVWKSELADATTKGQNLEQQLVGMEARLKLLEGDRSDALASTGLADSSSQSVRDLANALEAQYEATGVDIGGKTARQSSLAAAIAKLSDRVAATLKADPITDQLQEVVDIRQKELDDAKKARSAASVSDAEVDRAVAALAEAKVAVLVRREAAAHAAGADTIHKWNDDLLSLSIDLDELHARMTELQTRLRRLRDMLDMVDGKPSAESLTKLIEEIKTSELKMGGELTSLRANLDAEQPGLTVVESRDEPAH